MAEPKRLSLLSETVFESKASSGFPLSCPTLDLSTTWDAPGKALFIIRPPAQTVSKIHQAGIPGTEAPEVTSATWKPDGKCLRLLPRTINSVCYPRLTDNFCCAGHFLAVGWSDGVVRLMGLDNTKVAHHIPVCAHGGDAAPRISHIGWAICSLGNKMARDLPSRARETMAQESLHHEDRMPPLNLPQELGFLEVDTALPKVSPLPTGSAGIGQDATVFTTRAGIDFLFPLPKTQDFGQVHLMVVGTDDGDLQLNLYDSFLIGTFPNPVSDSAPKSRMISHAFHPQLPTHTLIFAEEEAEPQTLHLVPMDLSFISSSAINLSLLGTKLTTLQKLLKYVRQAQQHMQTEWKGTRDLPSRFLRNVQGDLEKLHSGPRGIVPALYHTVVTGHAYEPLREWLVDSLAERGHKRWDKAVVSGLENLRGLIHENFLPALDRCAIILSRLRGLAQFHDDRDDIGFSVTQISRTLDIIGCLSFVGHEILSVVMDELEHFKAFSTWLRFQIDRFASSTTAADELTEKEATIDTSKVLRYIQRFLTNSPLDIFFSHVSKEDWQADWDYIEDGVSLLPILDSQLRKQESEQASRKALQRLDFLVSYATSWGNRIFDGIAEAKKRSVRFGKPVKLSINQPITAMDIRLCQKQENRGVSYVAIASKAADDRVHIFRTAMDITNGISTNHPTMSVCVSLTNRKLIDVKFLNDETLVLLCSNDNKTISVVLLSTEAEHLHYLAYDESKPQDIHAIQRSDLTELVLPPEYVSRPVKMQVHDKTALHGALPARIYLLAGNRMTWRAFTLPE